MANFNLCCLFFCLYFGIVSNYHLFMVDVYNFILFLGVSVTGLISLPKLSIQYFYFNAKLGQCILLGFKDPSSVPAIALNSTDKLFGFGGMFLLVCCNTIVILANRARQQRMMNSSRKTPQKLTVLAIVVMCVFVLSVLPYFIVKIIFHLDSRLMEPPMNPWLQKLAISSYYLMHISSTINPVLYVLQGRESKCAGKITSGCFQSRFQSVVSTFRVSRREHSRLSQVNRNLGAGSTLVLSSANVDNIASVSQVYVSVSV